MARRCQTGKLKWRCCGSLTANSVSLVLWCVVQTATAVCYWPTAGTARLRCVSAGKRSEGKMVLSGVVRIVCVHWTLQQVCADGIR